MKTYFRNEQFVPSLLLFLITCGLLLPLTVSESYMKSNSQDERLRTFTCYNDAYVDSSNPSSNYEIADLEVVNSSLWEKQSYLSFQIKNLPSDANISIVTLELSIKYLPSDDHTVPLDIWKTSTFGEATITWDSRPNFFGKIGALNIAENKRWNIQLYNHNLSTNEFFHICLTTELDNFRAITFDDQDDMWNPPKLAITYLSFSTETNGALDGDAGFIVMIYLLLSVSVIIGIPLYLKKRQKPKSERYSIVLREESASNKCKPGNRFCGHCGVPLELDNQFCTSCGKQQ